MNRPITAVAGLSDPGRVRDLNEDRIGTPDGMQVPASARAQKGELLAVADGMGGHAGGEVASQLAVATLYSEYYADPSPNLADSLRRAVERANAEVHAQAASGWGKPGMGTTLVAAVVHGSTVVVANVGDSRAYLIRGGRARQISQDHSWVAESVAAGVLTPDQARAHTYRSVITRFVGQKPQVDVDLFRERMLPGDTLLLCSDGLTNEVDEAQIAAAVGRSTPQDAAAALVELANQNGGRDNISAVVARIPPAAGPPRPLPLAWIGASAAAGLLVVALFVRLLAGGGLPAAVPSASPSLSPAPTSTFTPAPEPSDTPAPSPTALPTVTPIPTATPVPSHTPRPTAAPARTPTSGPLPILTGLPPAPGPQLQLDLRAGCPTGGPCSFEEALAELLERLDQPRPDGETVARLAQAAGVARDEALPVGGLKVPWPLEQPPLEQPPLECRQGEVEGDTVEVQQRGRYSSDFRFVHRFHLGPDLVTMYADCEQGQCGGVDLKDGTQATVCRDVRGGQIGARFVALREGGSEVCLWLPDAEPLPSLWLMGRWSDLEDLLGSDLLPEGDDLRLLAYVAWSPGDEACRGAFQPVALPDGREALFYENEPGIFDLGGE